MEDKMFCFQCEQTAACTACTGKAGVCGKPFDVAFAQDELTGALVGLAQTELVVHKRTRRADELIVNGLFTCVTNVNFDKETIVACGKFRFNDLDLGTIVGISRILDVS